MADTDVKKIVETAMALKELCLKFDECTGCPFNSARQYNPDGSWYSDCTLMSRPFEYQIHDKTSDNELRRENIDFLVKGNKYDSIMDNPGFVLAMKDYLKNS